MKIVNDSKPMSKTKRNTLDYIVKKLLNLRTKYQKTLDSQELGLIEKASIFDSIDLQIQTYAGVVEFLVGED